MGVTTTQTNKPFNPRGNDQSPKGYNRAALYSGKALDFDGVNDYVASDSFSLDTSEWSASMILKNDTAGSDQVFLTFAATGSNDESFIIYNNFANSNKISFYGAAFTGSPVVFDYVIPTDYEHLTFTFASNTLSLYVNGVFVDSGSVTGNDGTQTASAIVGARKQASYGQYFNGQVSGLKMYSTALTAAQIADLYNNPEKVVPTGVDNTALKLWLPMMEGAGTTAYDGSGNGNHGTISGATYVNGIGAPVAQSAVMDWNKGTNLISNSEDFVTGFSISNAVISQSNITAPDGSNLVRKLVATNANTFHLTLQSSTQSAGIYTQSVYAKAEGRNFLYINTRVDSGSNRYGVKFNVANGTYVDDATSGSPTNTSYSIQNMGNGWFRCSISIQHTSGTIAAVFSPAIAGAVNGINDGHQGDGVNGIYIWGGALSQSTIPQPYVRTGATAQTSEVLLPQGLTTGRDITGVNLFENVRKQGALNLDGNSWAEVHDNASVDLSDANASFEAWVYHIDRGSVSQYIFNKYTGSGAGFRIRTETSNNLGFYITDGTNDVADNGTKPLTANAWNHIVLTTDGTNFKRYIDGALVDTDVAGTALTTFANAGDLTIGVSQSLTFAAQSRIAQPRIYNRALTAEEVQRNYNAGKNTYTN